MRRNAADILFVYHYTHRVRRPFLPSVSTTSPSHLVPFSRPLSSVLLPFPRLSVSSVLLFSPVSLSLSPPPASRRVAVCIYFILLLNKPLFLSSSRQHASLHVHTAIHVKHSLHLTRGSAYATVPDTKNIFSLPSSLILGITPPPSRVPRYLRGCVGRLSRLLKGSSILKGSCIRA